MAASSSKPRIFVGDDEAMAMIQEFLNAQFASGQHESRIDKIDETDLVRGNKL